MNMYILDGHKPVLEMNPCKWAEWFSEADRVVARTSNGVVLVSTVFLGIDHSFAGGKPVLFESMAFLVKDFKEKLEEKRYELGVDMMMDRYCTWDDAKTGHDRMVEMMFNRLKQFEGPAKTLVDDMLVAP